MARRWWSRALRSDRHNPGRPEEVRSQGSGPDPASRGELRLKRAQRPLQVLLEDGGVVPLLVPGAVDQRQIPGSGRLQEGLPGGSIRLQLFPVSPPKLLPSAGVVAGPPPQPVGGGGLLGPAVDLESLLSDPPRPEAVDEEALPVPGGGRIVGALYPDHIYQK